MDSGSDALYSASGAVIWDSVDISADAPCYMDLGAMHPAPSSESRDTANALRSWHHDATGFDWAYAGEDMGTISSSPLPAAGTPLGSYTSSSPSMMDFGDWNTAVPPTGVQTGDGSLSPSTWQCFSPLGSFSGDDVFANSMHSEQGLMSDAGFEEPHASRLSHSPPEASHRAVTSLVQVDGTTVKGQRCPHPGCSSHVIFTRQCDLDKHCRIHERRYVCRVPQRDDCRVAVFATAKDRNRHESGHAPAITCEHCDRLFSRKDNLRDHCRKVHKGSTSIPG